MFSSPSASVLTPMQKMIGMFTLCFSISIMAGPLDKSGYYGFGTPVTAEEIAAWDIDVRPDGTGLPEGAGSVATGEIIYEEKCAECHGSFGEGVGRFPVIAGGEGSLQDSRPTKTVGSYWAHLSTLWDYIHRTMPYAQPESLLDNEVYSLTAYVLYLNDLVGSDFVLSKENFTQVQLPNRLNFVADSRPDVHNLRCMEKCKNPETIKIVSSAASPEIEVIDLAQGTVQQDSGGGRGVAVYRQSCAICHKVGLSGAPIPGDAVDWKARMDVGLSTLIRHAIDGFTGDMGFMPAKGGFGHLSDTEVTEAVEYMVEFER